MKKTILITLISLAFIGCKKDSAEQISAYTGCWVCSFINSTKPPTDRFCLNNGEYFPIWKDSLGFPLKYKCDRVP